MQFFSGSSLTSVAPDAPPGTAAIANAQVLYVFHRNGVCLLYREWHRPPRTLDATQDHRLMFGLLYSTRSFTAKIDPTA
jgi:trafficking protein particle complex subunit 1